MCTAMYRYRYLCVEICPDLASACVAFICTQHQNRLLSHGDVFVNNAKKIKSSSHRPDRVHEKEKWAAAAGGGGGGTA